MENSSRDGNTRPPDLPLEKPVYITDDEAIALKKVVEKGISEDAGLALQILKSLNVNIESVHIVPDLPGHYHAILMMLTATQSKASA